MRSKTSLYFVRYYWFACGLFQLPAFVFGVITGVAKELYRALAAFDLPRVVVVIRSLAFSVIVLIVLPVLDLLMVLFNETQYSLRAWVYDDVEIAKATAKAREVAYLNGHRWVN